MKKDISNITTLSELIRCYRVEELHMTQEDFAANIDVSLRSLQYWEKGGKIPSVNNIHRIFFANPYYKDIAFSIRNVLLGGDLTDNEEGTSKKNQSENEYGTVSIDNELSRLLELKNSCKDIYKVYGKDVFIPIQQDQPVNCRTQFNTLIIGAAGTGKGYCYLKPNLLPQHNCNYFLTVRKGELTKEEIESKMPGYDVFFMDDEFLLSGGYNPFDYISTDDEINMFVRTFIMNTNASAESPSDVFFTKEEELILCRLMKYVLSKHSHPVLHDINNEYNYIMELYRSGKLEKDTDEYNVIFDGNVSEKTMCAVLFSIGVRFAVFSLSVKKHENCVDFMKLIKVQNQVIVLELPCCDITLMPIVNCFIRQFMHLLMQPHDTYVKVIFDEFANIGYIDCLSKLLATNRRHNFSVDMLIQSIEQLMCLYKTEANSMISNSNHVFLGGRSMSDAKFISDLCGVKTVQQKSIENNNDICQRKVLDEKEILTMKNCDELVFLSGFNYILTKKNGY